MKELALNLLQERNREVCPTSILDVTEDVIVCLEKGDEDEHKTSQQCVGIKSMY